ncbi:hypothetical protein OMAG_001886 [Candidatus Omnitrophus magneticus]|uniref:Uncharacterized protein n=1 Tax=Candidatus Omnitrophus magneticus TaxID=1609969 RepID=A0A0F0CLQ2_9BACT|nr:hypothetical protein OMAG_001886 [Candidatus Omnitrophus magneticus]
MKELVYKTIEGNDPIKKEISIEELENKNYLDINKKWSCKYFIKSRYEGTSIRDIKEWIANNKNCNRNIKSFNVLKFIDNRTGETKILCKAIGEFFVVHNLKVVKILYVNAIRIHITPKKERSV